MSALKRLPSSDKASQMTAGAKSTPGRGQRRGGSLAVLALSLLFSTAGGGHPTLKTELDRPAFNDALDLVLSRYVEPVDSAQMLSRGLQHMVAGLDPHSVYLDAPTRAHWQRAKDHSLSHGLHLQRAAGTSAAFEVASVVKGSSAYAQGIRRGDWILSIAGKPASAFIHPFEAELAALADFGKSVVLELRSSGTSSRTLKLPSTQVAKMQVVESHSLDAADGAKVGMICVHAFLPGVGDQVRRQLEELRRSNGGRLDGLILDLRGNPGGEVNEALVIAELFVDHGILVRTRGRGGKILREERAHAKGTNRKLALVVLQDAHSASASELLAAALQSHKRATIVGETSYGKGTVQAVQGLPDGSQLRLTVARYFDPDDRSIEGRGVTPDRVLNEQAMSDAVAEARAILLAG